MRETFREVTLLNMQKQRDYYTAGEAARYLAQKWGIESYSTTAFRLLRWRWKIQPDMHLGNASLWKQETLDAIPKPDRSKPRPRNGIAPIESNTSNHNSEENIPDDRAKHGEKSSVSCSDGVK